MDVETRRGVRDCIYCLLISKFPHDKSKQRQQMHFLLGDPRSEPVMQCVLCLEWTNIEKKVCILKGNLKKLLFFSLMPYCLTSVFIF